MNEFLERTGIVVDTETTGLDTAKDRVWELAVAVVAGGQVVESKSWLLYPEGPLSPDIVRICRLTVDDCERISASPTFHEAAGSIVEWIDRRQPRFVLGHNLVSYDLPLLAAEFLRAGVTNPLALLRPLDSLIAARALLRSHVRSRSLGDLYKSLALPSVGEAHRAEADCRMAWAVFKHLTQWTPTDLAGYAAWQEAQSAKQQADFAQYRHYLYEDAGVLRMGFGKHTGVALHEVDASYLRWLLRQDRDGAYEPLPERIRELFEARLNGTLPQVLAAGEEPEDDEEPEEPEFVEDDLKELRLAGMDLVLLPDGAYRAKVEEVRVRENRHGLPAVLVDFEVVDGQYTGAHLFRWLNLPVVGSAAVAGEPAVRYWRQALRMFLRAIGDGNGIREEVDPDTWRGAGVLVHVVGEDRQGDGVRWPVVHRVQSL